MHRTPLITPLAKMMPTSVVAVDSEGRKLRDVAFTVKGILVKFEIRENEFAYVLRKDEQ